MSPCLRRRRSVSFGICGKRTTSTGAILGLLPVGFFAFLWLTARRDMAMALGTSLGRTAIVVGLALETAAFLWIRRLLRVDP